MTQFNMDNPDFGSSNQETPQKTAGLAIALCGAALAAYGLTRRSRTGLAIAAAGGYLALRNQSLVSKPGQYSAQASFAINTTPDQAYRFWKDFENLPRFMRHLKSVRTLGSGETEWTAWGPMGQQISWKARTTEDVENERIAWQSTPDSTLQNRGSVEFRRDPTGRGTVVRVSMEYTPPAGALGRVAAFVFGKHPEFTVREDLRRFKALIEAGEVPTTAGQTHGPRGAHGRVEQFLFREEPDVPSSSNDNSSRLIA